MGRHLAGKVIARVHIVRIYQQSAVHPVLCAFGIPQSRKSIGAVGHGRSIIRILRQSLFGSGERDLRNPPSSLGISEGGVTGE